MLYTKIQPQSFLGSVEDLSVFTIYGHCGHLTFWTVNIFICIHICTNYQSPFDKRLDLKFEENFPKGLREEVVQRCGWMMERQMDGLMTDGK